MSEAKYTPGELAIEAYIDGIYLLAPDGARIAEMCDREIGPVGMPPDNARRLRDTWNALSGVPDPAAFVASHAELLAIVERFDMRYRPWGKGSECLVTPDSELGSLLADARAAIAKAKEATP